MTEAALYTLAQRGLLLCLVAALPPLVVAALCGGLVELLLGRLGVSEPTAPALARLVGGFLTLLFLAPWLSSEMTRYATALWAQLQVLGR